MIITGAPIEHLEFEEVDYWEEMVRIMDWAITMLHRQCSFAGLRRLDYITLRHP